MPYEELIARTIARMHFERREWRGACTKEERTQWLVDRYWPQWRGDATVLIRMMLGVKV